MTQYKRPPITEAVIEIRFEDSLPKELVDKLHERLRGGYASSEVRSSIGLQVDLQQRQARFDASDEGHKLASKDQADILLVTPASMVCSRLAPYIGWDGFRARAEENWKKWKRVAGYRKIKRLGLRYINRIDVPLVAGKGIEIEDFLGIYPMYPENEILPGLLKHTMQIVGPLGHDNLILTINSNLTSSPLVDHVSLVLDIDIASYKDIPQKDDDVWAMFDMMRVQKNRVFEACITDNARKLFEK